MPKEIFKEVEVFVERRVRDRRRVDCNRDEIICRRSLPDRRGNPHPYRVCWWQDPDCQQPETDRGRRLR